MTDKPRVIQDPVVEQLDGIMLTLDGKEGGTPKQAIVPTLVAIIKEMYLVQKEIRKEVCPPESFISDRDVAHRISGPSGT
jgi:hypothetical protein